MNSEGIKAILLDLDNTLIDTAGAGGVAIQKVSSPAVSWHTIFFKIPSKVGLQVLD